MTVHDLSDSRYGYLYLPPPYTIPLTEKRDLGGVKAMAAAFIYTNFKTPFYRILTYINISINFNVTKTL